MFLLPKKIYIYVIIFFVFVFQYVNSDYGNKVNNFSYLDASHVQISDLIKITDNNSITGADIIRTENNDKRLMRFALYSIESDEMLNIRALSRIRPSELQFDPHYYAYGGGYLYPLGAWFLILKKAGVIQIGDLKWMLENPDKVKEIYRYGRIFVLIAFLISALFLYHLICIFQKPSVSLLAVIAYVCTPSLIMFSIIMKPHAYALIWCNLALLMLFQSWKSREISHKNIALIGISVGFAVGSILTYGVFALFVWFGLLYVVVSNKIKATSLFIVPLISIITFFILNPYVILNFDAFIIEYAAQKAWFDWDMALIALTNLISNSILLGLGVSYGILLFYILTLFFRKSSSIWNRLNILAIWFTVLFIAFISASVSKWHVNSRYFFYLVPILLIVFTFYRKRNINLMLSVLLAFNLLQSFPLVLAYHDEDNEQYSTRLKSAIWINNNIDKNKTICTSGKSITPYDAPPFDFKSYHIATNTKGCDVLISIERQSDQVDTIVNSSLLARFKPRYTLEQIPFVFSHINPQISIYRLENEK